VSLLIWELRPESATVITDSLFIEPGTGRPIKFGRKCAAFPHLGLMMASLGQAGFAAAWERAILDVPCLDIESLNTVAPWALRKINADFNPDNPKVLNLIFHFGFDPERGVMVGYRYDSMKDFEPQLLPNPALQVNPNLIFVHEQPAPQGLDDFIALGVKLRGWMEQYHFEGRIGDDPVQLDEQERLALPRIGGDLIVTQAAAGRIASATVHRFDDYLEQWKEMGGFPEDRVADALERIGAWADSLQPAVEASDPAA
jgi:hypothetical protein